jgi:error-prone DNA polymerase
LIVLQRKPGKSILARDAEFICFRQNKLFVKESNGLCPHKPNRFVHEKASTKDLPQGKDGDVIKIAGLVLVRQRPGTAGGICFMTIEDEWGFANLVIFQSLFDTYRKEILQSKLIMVEGKLQIEGEVIHVIVRKCHDLSKLLRALTPTKNETPNVQTLAFPDETSIPPGLNKRSQVRERTNEQAIPGARNFK